MLVKLYDRNPDPRTVRRIVNVLRDGGIVIYPTDTIYAIGCDIFQARAVEKICRIKGVAPEKANLSFICKDLSQISDFSHLSNPVFKLLKRNLPGPFTFILTGSSQLPKLFKQRRTVGVRVPDNGIVQAIVEELGNPLMTASLKDYEGWSSLLPADEADNGDFDLEPDFGLDPDEMPAEYATDPELIDERYGSLVDMVIDGGMGRLEPSTIVDCTGDWPVLVRQGLGELRE